MQGPFLPFSKLDDDAVKALLAQHSIGLSVDEARAVSRMLGRDPTLTEAVIWGIQGSEHCSYKSSRRFLSSFPTTGKHVILGPKEDSGIVAITDGPPGKRWGIVVSHESHNHPSQVVPYEGAATGVGGCVRDVLCMGARVIGSMDSLRLGDLASEESRAIAADVIRGVAGYGNALGIPNLGGDTVFDSAYNKSCLVNVVSLGLIREDEIIHSFVPAEAGRERYDIIIVGKATDRSGFGGASFASATMEEDDQTKNAGAVQEPNPFLERHLLASTYALFDTLARDGNLSRVSFKDLGAGGNVCATVEQVAPSGMGAVVNLDAIHVALPDLPPEVIACAETQERFCWMCHPSLTASILHHYNDVWDLPSVAENARASVVGYVTTDSTYTLTYKGHIVCSASSQDITSGLRYTRPTAQRAITAQEPNIQRTGASIMIAGVTRTIDQVFRSLITTPSHASKSRVFRHYDKNILGNTVIEPGEADATVIQPLLDLECLITEGTHPGWSEHLSDADRRIGVALACGGLGRYGRLSAYAQGVLAVAENVRNIATVGAVPRAISDCLNYGNPEVPEDLGCLEDGIRGISDAARALGVDGEPIPVISGNVSLYNTTSDGPIDPTANVCVIGVMPDARVARHQSFKKVGSSIILIGERKDQCGASAYYQVLESSTSSVFNAFLGANVPLPDLALCARECRIVTELVRSGKIMTAHDISEGGLALALFEMTAPVRRIGGAIGYDIDLATLGSDLPADILLFSETGGFVFEVANEHVQDVLDLCSAASVFSVCCGSTISEPSVSVHMGHQQLLHGALPELHAEWTHALDKAIGSIA